MTEIPLFNLDELIGLVKAYRQMQGKDNMQCDYESGVCQGLDFVLYLLERTER